MYPSPRFILATSSVYRQAQFASLGVNATIIAPDIDESPLTDEQPGALAERLAAAKAGKVAAETENGIVIAGDQVASLTTGSGTTLILGKPGTHEAATEQLLLSSDRCVTFYSALSIIDAATKGQTTATEITKVHFRSLSKTHIEQYLRDEKPYDCAGSFKSEGKGTLLFERIESRDPNALIGLPVMLLRDMLAGYGIDLLLLATSLTE
ncbi:MAG: septum formation protein Maf [Alteromonadaceae bacterium]|nr:septum formation protein Maf [Alteromonadaceae bacterium]